MNGSLLRIAGVLLMSTMSYAQQIPSQADLDAAPPGNVEKLGVVQQQARICTQMLSPATKDYPARYLIGFWSMADRKYYATFVVNLSTGAFRKVDAPGFDKDTLRWPTQMGDDGKCFFGCLNGGLAVYDPAMDEFKHLRPIPKSGWLRGLAIGTDGAVYASDYPTGSAARYDPKTGEVENYGPQGGPFEITSIYGYSVGAEGDWVYTAAGKIPWYVVACNRKTKQQTNLFKFKQEDFPNVVQRRNGVFLSVSIVDQAKNTSRTECYRLENGKATKIENLPPNDPAPARAWDGIPQPVVQSSDQGLPFEDNAAVLLYRPAGAADFSKALLPVTPEPYNVQRIAPMGDGRVLVAPGSYGNVYLFDPKTNKYDLVGNPAKRNIYSMLVHDGSIYFAGYSNAILGVFEKGDGVILHDYNRMLGSKHSYGLAVGGDGFIYLANQAEREFVGGSLAWWNPKTKEPGGIRFPNDVCERVISVDGGKLMVVATQAVNDPTHPEIKVKDGNLIVYDTAQRKVLHKFAPITGADSSGSAGFIAEGTPGIVVGLASVNKKGMIYVANAREGKTLQSAALPAEPKGDLQRGPDGQLYGFLGDTLVRIDAKTYAVTPLCKAAPGRIVFVDRDAYLSGGPELRRIKDVAK
jgi:hypothetical protein